jgi:hypothetical protein
LSRSRHRNAPERCRQRADMPQSRITRCASRPRVRPCAKTENTTTT